MSSTCSLKKKVETLDAVPECWGLAVRVLSLSTLPLALPPHPGCLQFGPLPGGPGLVVLVTVPARPRLPAVAGDGMPHCPHSVTVQGPTGRPSVRTRMRSRVALLRFYGLRSFVFFKCENLNPFKQFYRRDDSQISPDWRLPERVLHVDLVCRQQRLCVLPVLTPPAAGEAAGTAGWDCAEQDPQHTSISWLRKYFLSSF